MKYADFIPRWRAYSRIFDRISIQAGARPLKTTRLGRSRAGAVRVIEPRDIQQQVDAIYRVLAWTDAEYRERSSKLIQIAERYQNWMGFEQGVTSAISIVGQIGNSATDC